MIITFGNPKTRFLPTSRKQKFKIIPLILNYFMLVYDA